LRKIDVHKLELKALLNEFLKTNDEKPLIQYFTKNSNLPGRRGNIEMAAAFDDIIREEFQANIEEIWKLSIKLTQITSSDAPTNNPKEMIPFCGTRAIGSIGAISDDFFKKSLIHLKELANDSRWRMREAVAASIGRILLQRGQKLMNDLIQWTDKDNWLEMRAVVTGVAHPTALSEKMNSKLALDLHKTIIQRILDTEDRKSETFKILRKGLCYTLSVVTQANPDEGFSYMKHLIEFNDKDINLIVRENLKKNRLKKNFPTKVSSLTKILKKSN
jgi:hypothetical protein